VNQIRRLQSSERRYIAANGEINGWTAGMALKQPQNNPAFSAFPQLEPRSPTANGSELILHLKLKNKKFLVQTFNIRFTS
jgi:hypothetical protein